MRKVIYKLTLLIASLIILIGFWLNAHHDASFAQKNFSSDSLHRNYSNPLIPTAQLPDVQIALQPIASGFNLPVHLTNAGDGSNRLFVVQQDGRIKYIENYQNNPKTTFLDISDRVGCCDEQTGLFSVAFPPDFATKRHFYVFYTNKVQTSSAEFPISDKIIISRFGLLPNNMGDPASEQILLRIDLPVFVGFKHKGGQLAFSPIDHYLYITVGDGGQKGMGQTTNTLLGKILRLDVETGNPVTYTIPASNPFTQTAGYRPEIWTVGVRNPWRGGFDIGSSNGEGRGDYYLGDVGLNTREEIDYQAANTPGGLNYGWACREGTLTNLTTAPCNNPALLASMTDPIAEYAHTPGQPASVTGGLVYRGSLYPALAGRYFFSDQVNGQIWSLYKTGPNTWSAPELELDTTFQPSTFGQDEHGELFIVHMYGGQQIYRIIDSSALLPNLTKSSKKASTDYANPGEVVSYTIIVSNTGGLTTTTAFVTDTIPSGLTYVPGSLAASAGTVNASASPVLRWQGALSPTKQITITYKVTVTTSSGSFTNQARVAVAGVNPLTLTNVLNVPRLTNTTTITDFFLPGTQPNKLTQTIAEPGVCQSCHTAPIYTKWRGSMMSQAGRDPLMWSALHIANKDAPEAGDYCLRCHTPKGWLEGHSHPADGSALDPNQDIPVGVTCEVCHRLVDPAPGSTDSAATIDAGIRTAITPTIPYTSYAGSGMMILDPQDRRRGPFTVNAPHTPTYQTDFVGQTSANLTRSRLCGSCHNVDNPTLSWDQTKNQYWPNSNNQAAPSFLRSNLFPIERTFEEWKNSAYVNGVFAPQFAGAKAVGIVGACQDCHMSRTTGKAASFETAVNRDCQTTGCLPAHEFFGGNVWVPQLLQDARWRLKSDDVSELNNTITNASLFLQKSATMFVTLATSGTTHIATVRVSNETGHKLPTGYPEGRRMWINLKAYNANNQLIFEAGAYNGSTGVLDQGSTKVYEAKLGITPEFANLLNRPGITQGETFHFVLNNVILKDNRIPPRGFTAQALSERGLKPVGATYAPGQFWDDTTYTVPANTTRVVATLYYQTSSKEYIDFLRNNGGADGATLGQMWDDSKSPPVQVAVAKFPFDVVGVYYLPLVLKNK